MINYAELLILGAIAGFTIFLGLPLALLRNVSGRKRGFLNAVAIGILIFLIIDVFSNAWNTTSNAALIAFTTKSSATGAILDLASRPSTRFLITAGLVGGGPTFLGTMIGSLIGVSDFTYVLFLSIAGGALVYVTLLMYNSGRRMTTNDVLMVGTLLSSKW